MKARSNEARLLGVGRRQIEAQHVAAAEQIAAVDQQHAVAIVDARARLGRRNQTAQHRRDALRIDREFDAVQRLFGRAVAFARSADSSSLSGSMVIDESVSTVAEAAMAPAMISPCTSRLCTRASIRPARNWREIDDADGKREQPGDVEDDDAAGEARGALRDEKLPGAAQPLGHLAQAARGRPRLRLAAGFGLGLSFDGGQRRGPCRGFCGSIEHVVCRVPSRPDPAIAGRGRTPLSTARQPSSQRLHADPLRLGLRASIRGQVTKR